MRYPLVIGNWKLNGSQQFVEQLLGQLVAQLDPAIQCQVAVAPPAPYLVSAKQLLATSPIAVAAQNCDLHQTGAYTGEIASAMLKDIGVAYVIIGHSERRQYHHETNAIIAEKFALIKQQQLTPVLCIGETAEQNSAGETQAVCAKQIDAVIQHLGITAFQGSVIAYEPIWAIGTGKSATPEQAQQTHAFIRAHLAKHDAEIAKQVIIQYGGSVTADNAAALFKQTDIDGALVGGASLKADNFIAIVNAAAASQSA